MTDSTSARRGGSDFLPPPTIYDPAEDPDVPPGTDPSGAVVALLVAESDRRWAAETALALSAAWARSGRRIVLADLHLENPVLHELTGDDNLEGVVDVFLYGASIARSARPVDGRGFYLIPTGTYTPDVGEIYRHPRWPKLVAGFREVNASLVLFAPAEGADLDALSRWASEVIVLGAPRDPASLGPLAVAGVPVRAHIIEPQDAVRAPAASGAPIAPVIVEEVRDDDELHLPPPPPRPGPRRRRAALVVWLALGIVALATAGYLVGSLRPDLLPWAASAVQRPDTALAVAPPMTAVPAPPTRQGEALPYSVQVIAFQSLPAALERFAVDRERVTTAPVILAPEEIDGILYYKILAGAAADTAAARRLKEKLVTDGVVDEEDAAGAWTLVQSAPLAFELGEYPNQESARAAADSLLTRRVPTYSVAVPYSDSTRRWQMYAGAYRDSVSAEAMRGLLRSAGLTPPLVARTGLAPTAQ